MSFEGTKVIRSDKVSGLLNNSGIKSVRTSGVFLLSLIEAVLGTAVVETSLYPLFPVNTPRALLLKEDLLSAAVAFALGCFVYKWQPPSKWVWVAGFFWFGLGALLVLARGSTTIYQELSGIGCVYNVTNDSCSNYFLFTVPSLRAVSFSAGALFCSALSKGIGKLGTET